MDRLRQIWADIAARLGVMTLSQRLAIGLCAALAGVCLLWLMQWSATPSLVPLVNGNMSYDELASVEQALQANGIDPEVRGMRIFVPTAQRHNALRVAHAADALPDGSLLDMEDAVGDTNPFESPDARAFKQNYAMANELAKIIESSPAVRKARVMINPKSKRRLGGLSDVPTASVTVTLGSSHEMSQAMVEGFAKLVAGAVAGLKPYDVAVTDARTMRAYSLPHPDDLAGFDILTMTKRREEHIRDKILGTLLNIPGVHVAVSVDLDTSKRVTTNLKHNEPQPKTESTDSTEQSSATQPSEPGVQANLGQAITAGSAGTSNTSEKTETENFPAMLTQSETIEQMPFAIRTVTASIKIPRSFVVGVFNAQNGTPNAEAKDNDPAFVEFRDAELLRIKSGVERVVMTKNSDDVVVDIYPDMEWTVEGGVLSHAPGATAGVADGSNGDDTMALLRTYGPQAGLAGLALVSLLMMTRMAGKSTKLAAQRTAGGGLSDDIAGDEVPLTVGPSSVGQAGPSDSVLAGREVDPETLRTQELGLEVSKLVDADPAGTAELLRRWVAE